MAGNISDENDKKKQDPNQPAPQEGFGDDFLSQLGLDIGEISGAVEEIITDQPQVAEGPAGVRETAGGIELTIDEELDSQIDEEAKMFLADKHFRANEFYEALIPALELNIRVRQGRSKRDDVLVKRQNEIIFESNYQLGKYHLVQASKTSGDIATHHRLMGLMHLYGAIDQSFQPGQEAKRKEIGQYWKQLIYGYRFGQYYIKYGMFSTLTIPGPEDNSSKAEFWSYLGAAEADKLAKEMYMLMAYSYDLSYYRYQVRLATYYVETNRSKEGCRYIQVPLPAVEDDGIAFLQTLLKKDPAQFDAFVSKEFQKDVKRLTTLAEAGDHRKLHDIMSDWRFRLSSMTIDVPYKNSTVRLEYLKAFQKLMDEMQKSNPTILIDQYMSDYKRVPFANKVPVIQEFVYIAIFYSLEMNEKAKTGFNVFEIDAEAFIAVVYSVAEYFRILSNDKDPQKQSALETQKAVVKKTFSRFQSSLQSKGYTVSREPRLTV